MTEQEMHDSIAMQNALLNQLHQCGMRPLEGSEAAILGWFQARGVTCSAPDGYLVLVQADGSAAVPSAACETLRKELPHLFVPDPKRDAVSSRQDLERGTPEEISRAKAAFVRQHGLDAWEALPRTKAEAERQSVAPSPDMTCAEYLGLSFRERSRLAGILKPDGISKIMRRKG